MSRRSAADSPERADGADPAHSAGHTVLVIPVPALETYVRARTAHYDASFVSADPAFRHAHITLLGPWLPSPTADDLSVVGRIAARTAPFTFTLDRVGQFPDGLLHLPPDPAGPFSAITAALVAVFPQTPPYGGVFPTPEPHLTLDRRAPGITAATVRRDLGDLVPATCVADRIDLQWWANHDCRLLHSWPLGPGAGGRHPAATGTMDR